MTAVKGPCLTSVAVAIAKLSAADICIGCKLCQLGVFDGPSHSRLSEFSSIPGNCDLTLGMPRQGGAFHLMEYDRAVNQKSKFPCNQKQQCINYMVSA